MTENRAVEQDKLTGKVFVRSQSFPAPMKTFQLEAIIDGNVTRLQAEGEVPEACLYDKRHSGLKINGVMESLPPQYNVGCDCGYSVTAHDVNQLYVPFGEKIESQDKINELEEVVVEEIVEEEIVEEKIEEMTLPHEKQKFSLSAMKTGSFFSGFFVGVFVEFFDGRNDSNTENFLTSVLAGVSVPLTQIGFYRVPALKWLCPSERDHLDDGQFVKAKAPYMTAGIMTGQTIAKYVKQGFS